MKIENIKINNFGKINNKEINLTNGINIIYGKNESGKSTLLNFIKSTFYGINKSKKTGEISDLEKYMPWNVGEFSGKIKYRLDNGKTYEIFRDFTKKNPKIFNEYSEDITSKFSIDKNSGSKFFYEQTKVDKDLFLSTVVSEQQKVKLDKDNQYVLVQKMANLIGTGNDNISYNKTINKLNKKISEEIGTNRTQDKPINRINKRIREIEEEIKELQIFSDKKYSVTELKEEKQAVLNKEKQKLELIKKVKQIREKEKIEKEKININANIKLEYENKIDKLQKEYKNISSKSDEKTTISYIMILLAVIINIATIITKNISIIIIGIIASIILILFTRMKYNKNKKDIRLKVQKKKEKILNEIDLLKQSSKEKAEDIINIENRIKSEISIEIDNLRVEYINKIDILELNEIINNTNINEQIDKTQENINSILLYLQTLEIEQKNIMEKLEQMSTLKEELNELENEYEILMKNHESINLAKEILEISYSKMKNEITPRFTKVLSENINKITNGMYNNVKFNDEKGLIVEMENGDYIPAEYLSIGTVEQLYLSLRFAAIEEITDEKMPIILDEAFAFYDEERLTNILNYIYDRYHDRQILILTCTEREEKLMRIYGIKYNLIKM